MAQLLLDALPSTLDPSNFSLGAITPTDPEFVTMQNNSRAFDAQGSRTCHQYRNSRYLSLAAGETSPPGALDNNITDAQMPLVRVGCSVTAGG